jgi:hypothetical protein
MIASDLMDRMASDCMRNVRDSTSRMIARPHRIPNSLIEGSSA